MRSSSKQVEFIRMKAEGKSNAQIAKILHISESTASRYTHLLEEKIAQYKAEQLQALYDAFHMTREARIRRLGSTLAQIDNALEQAELATVPPEKLLDLKLKYLASLKAEHIPLREHNQGESEADQRTADSILRNLNYLLRRLQDGDLTREQAEMEAKLLDAMLKGVELVELEERLSEIEKAVVAKKGRA